VELDCLLAPSPSRLPRRPEAQCLRCPLYTSGTRGPEVAQQVGGSNAELAVLIEEPGLGFRVRETLDLRQQLAENRFFRTAELVIIAQVAQRLTCNGANYPRYAII
jgi:hypothetical protein